MKKIFTYIAAMSIVALAVLSCQTVPEDKSHTDVVVPAPNVTITVNSVTDNSATITIAPDGAAAYFSYVVDASDEAEELDAAILYANKYKAVDNGIAKYEAQKTESIVVELENLEENVTYQVYAVAGSTTGVVGKIAVKSFVTSDHGLPAIDDTAKKENIYQILFTEAVTYNSSTPVTAKYYAANTIIVDKSGEKPVLTFDGEQGDAKVDVLVDGKVAQFTVTLDGEKPLPNGAYYAINIPEGAFVDAIGNKLPEVPIKTGLTSSGTLGFGNIYGRITPVPFELEEEENKTVVKPGETSVAFSIPEDVTIVKKFGKAAKATITVESKTSSKETTTVYTLKQGTTFDLTEENVTLAFPADIVVAAGDNMIFDIAEASFEDIYGNTNAALNAEYLYSFGYTLDDVIGTYKISGVSGYGPAYNEPDWTFTIAASDDSEKGNVMVTEYYGLETKIYASFNFDLGEFTMPLYYTPINYTIEEGVYTEWYTYGYYSCAQKAKNPLILRMTESGVFSDGNDYLGYYYESYKLPESGNPEDIKEEDLVAYDYNIFSPVMNRLAPNNITKKAIAFPTFEKTSIKRIQ